MIAKYFCTLKYSVFYLTSYAFKFCCTYQIIIFLLPILSSVSELFNQHWILFTISASLPLSHFHSFHRISNILEEEKSWDKSSCQGVWAICSSKYYFYQVEIYFLSHITNNMYSRVNASRWDKWPLEYSVVVVSKQIFCNDFHFRPEFIFGTNVRTLRQDFLLINIRRPYKTLQKPLQRTLGWQMLHIAIHVTHHSLFDQFASWRFIHGRPILQIIFVQCSKNRGFCFCSVLIFGEIWILACSPVTLMIESQQLSDGTDLMKNGTILMKNGTN